MKTLDDLRTFYERELAADLRALEARRAQILRNALIAGGIGAGLGLLVAAAALAQGAPPPIFLAALLAGLLVGGIALIIPRGGYVRDFKHRIIARLIDFLAPGLRYAPQGCISRDQFSSSGLFQHHIDRYHGEDLVAGRVGRTELAFSEIHAEYKTQSRDSKGRTSTHWHTIFKGLFFIADFNKHFGGRTYVLPDTAERLFGRFGRMFQSWTLGRGELIKLEDPEFENEFVVYGDDQIEARYILSTSLMERILDFKRKTGSTVYLAFVGSCVHVAVEMHRDLFEPRLLSPAADFAPVREYAEDLALAINIVDDLNLNTRIWSKQ